MFGPDQPVFPAQTEAKLGTSCTRVSPMELTLTLNRGIKLHSGPWSISLSQIMLSAWLFLSWPLLLRLCYFSRNMFSSPLFSPSAHASIRLSHPASLFSLLHDGSLSSTPRPSSFPSRCLALSNIQYPFLLLASCLWSPHFFFTSFAPFSNRQLTCNFLTLQCPLHMRLLITLGFGIWRT